MFEARRTRRFFTALTLLGALGCAGTKPAPACPEPVTAAAEPAAASSDPLAEIDARVERIRKAFDVPGLSVAIVRDGKVVHAKGYGVLERGKNDAVDENTVFAIASNTKAFLATEVALLVHEGKLGWDDKVTEHLPEFRMHDPHATADMRIRDLLSHRSGLDTWAGDLAWIGSNIDTDTLMKRLRHVEPVAGLRARYGYTNLMFMVAGEVVEKISGKAWDAELQDRVLKPLGMQRTTTRLAPLQKQENVATPHQGEGKEEVIVPYLNVDMVGAAASLNSSAADMARWLQLQLDEGRFDGKQVLPEAAVEALRVPHTPMKLSSRDLLAPSRHFLAYGLGWFLYDYMGHAVMTHGGGLPGMTSRVGLVPELELGVVVLTNSETAASFIVFQDIVDAHVGAEPKDYPAILKQREAEQRKAAAEKAGEPVEPGPASLAPAKYAGRYSHPLLGRAEITEKEGALRLSLPEHGGLDCPLTHHDGDVFQCKWENPIFLESKVTFDLANKKVKSVRFKVRPEFVDPVEYVFARGR